MAVARPMTVLNLCSAVLLENNVLLEECLLHKISDSNAVQVWEELR